MATPNDNDRIAVKRTRTRGGGWLWVLGAIILGVLALLLLIPFFTDDDSAGLDTGVTVSEIADAPATYIDRTVTVGGEVEQVIGPRAFMIGGDEFIGGDELLVVSANNLPTVADRPAGETLAANDLIQVTGPVRRFDLADFEEEIGFDLDDAAFGAYAGQPAIIARSVDLSPRAAPAAMEPDMAEPAVADANVTVADITGDTAAYLGKRVVVRGDVEAVIGANAFSIDEDALLDGGIDNDLLVVSMQEGLPLINEALGDANVTVLGTVRNFDLVAVEEELGYDLQDDLYTDWAGRPAVVASSIQAARGPMAEAGDQAGAVAPPTGAAEPLQWEANPSVADIAEDPAAYDGRIVAVQGEVEEVIGANAFSIDEDALLDGGIDNDLLVVSAMQDLPLLATEGVEDRRVMVIGPVRTFDLAAFEQELGFDLDDAAYEPFAGRAAIIAQAVGVTVPVAPAPAVAPPVAPAAVDPATVGAEALEEGNVTVAEIASNVAAFDGQKVTVRQEVEEVLGPNAFTLDEDALLAGGIDNDLLVVSAQENLPFINQELGDAMVQVQGMVREFDLAAFEQELGYDLDDNLFTDWAGRPAIVAQQITRLEQDQLAPPAEAGMTGEIMNVTVAEITSDMATYAGRSVAVREEVEEVLGPNAFTLDEDALFAGGIDDDLLVVSAQENLPFINDELGGTTATVWGTVRPFDLAAFEQEVGFDLDDTLYADWAGRPAIVARAIDVAAAAPAAEAGQPADAAGEPMTDMAAIIDAPDQPALAGHQAQLEDVTVLSVTGDQAFWVGPSEDRRLLVILDEASTSGGATEGRYDVNPGQTLTISGEIRQMPPMEEARQQWNLSDAASAELGTQQIYLHANQLEILEQ